MTQPHWTNPNPRYGSLDGDGAGDRDQPYRFGFRPRASVPYPFNTRQYARLLVLRGRVRDQLEADDALHFDLAPSRGKSRAAA